MAENRPSAWIRLTLSAPSPVAEAAADALAAITGRGVEVRDLDPRAEVVAYLPADDDAALARARELARDLAQGEDPGAVSLDLAHLDDQDWGANWKAHFHPFRAAAGLWIAPPWEEAPAGEGERVLIIDPGQAFGTGQHESTRLCLTRVVELGRSGRLGGPVLDLGCGTGVLGLAALMLGAPAVLGIDNDPLALEASRHNAALNGLEAALELSDEEVGRVGGPFKLILANLTADILCDLAPELARLLAPGGELVCSGVLLEQVGGVVEALEEAGIDLVRETRDGEWAALVLR